MKMPKFSSLLRGFSLQRDFDELKEAFLRYIKEETVGPFKSIGRYLAFGALGSIFVGFGAVLLLLGVLRYLQWQFRFLDGSESWIPYAAIVLAALLGLAVTIKRIKAAGGKPRRGSK